MIRACCIAAAMTVFWLSCLGIAKTRPFKNSCVDAFVGQSALDRYGATNMQAMRWLDFYMCERYSGPKTRAFNSGGRFDRRPAVQDCVASTCHYQPPAWILFDLMHDAEKYWYSRTVCKSAFRLESTFSHLATNLTSNIICSNSL